MKEATPEQIVRFMMGPEELMSRKELLAEIERLREALSEREQHKAMAEIERLRQTNTELSEDNVALKLVATSHEPEALRQQAEIERLRALNYAGDCAVLEIVAKDAEMLTRLREQHKTDIDAIIERHTINYQKLLAGKNAEIERLRAQLQALFSDCPICHGAGCPPVACCPAQVTYDRHR